jgi:septum formation protein
LDLILASASPQRRKLLGEAGYGFEVVPADVPEIAEGPEPVLIALLNAEAKARAVASKSGSQVVVLGADTVVDVDGMPLGQPADETEAANFLRLLSGTQHQVHTGVCVVHAEGERSGVASVRISFRELTDQDIAEYVELGEWRGRAGGYAIQETGDTFVSSVEGDFDCCVGLPMRLVVELLPESVQPA